jgi:hypothetical protein
MIKLNDWYSVKKEGVYPWPSATDESRTIRVYPDDVLCLDSNGTYNKQSGVCCLNIRVPEEALTHHTEEITLQIV